MTIRTRKLIGTIALLLLVAVYALAAMFVAIVLQVNASKPAELLYYVVAGLLWVLPAGLLVRWMQRPDPAPPADAGDR
jgi:peptidoglycan/LPS O-acetylase OafA/YrhL